MRSRRYKSSNSSIIIQMEEDFEFFIWYKSTAQDKENILSYKVRLTMLYRMEYWVVKNQHTNKISVTDVRMLH